MKCTSKEQETCNVEKMGCQGCYYYDGEELLEDKWRNKWKKECVVHVEKSNH